MSGLSSIIGVLLIAGVTGFVMLVIWLCKQISRRLDQSKFVRVGLFLVLPALLLLLIAVKVTESRRLSITTSVAKKMGGNPWDPNFIVSPDAHSTWTKLMQFGDYYKGDFGGVRVKIPKKMAWFFAYDNSENNGAPVISGFLIRTNYKYLLTGEGDPTRIGDFEDSAEIYVDAGSRYSERAISVLAKPCETGIRHDRYTYQRAEGKHEGLNWCFPTYDFSKYGEELFDFNIYYAENNDGQAMQVINCPNKDTIFMHCEQSFFLAPEMRVKLMVRYQKPHLKDWKKIEGRVREIFREFIISNPGE